MAFGKAIKFLLIDSGSNVVAIMDLEEKFPQERETEAKSTYGTNDQAHPGVAALHKTGDVLLAGKVYVLNRPVHQDFQQYRLGSKTIARSVCTERLALHRWISDAQSRSSSP